MMVLCTKGSEDFTKGKHYPIRSHQGRGLVAILNDQHIPHIILNHNNVNHVPRSYFDKYFEMTPEIETAYANGSIEK